MTPKPQREVYMSFDAKVRGLLASGCSKLQRGYLWKEGLIDTIDTKNPAGPRFRNSHRPQNIIVLVLGTPHEGTPPSFGKPLF